MDKSFEMEIIDRLSRIEEAVKNREALCDNHRAELVRVQKDIDGNGKPGIKKELEGLRLEFTKFEAKVLAYASVGSAAGGVIISFVMKKIGG